MSGSAVAASANAGPGETGVRVRPGLVYVRPPKTASTSVENLVIAAQGLSAETLVQVAEIYPDRNGAVDPRKCLVGKGYHVTWNDAARFLADPAAWRAIMTLRDPIARTLSHYRFLQQTAHAARSPGAHQRLLEEALARPLRELIVDESSEFFNWTMPVQTFFLGSTLRGSDPSGPARLLPDTVRSPAAHHEALRCALGRLERLAWIGIVESLDRDVQVLAFSQGWPAHGLLHDNRTATGGDALAASSELDPATRRVLADRLAADYVLLECAREIAAERYREMVETIGSVVNRSEGRA